MKLFAGIGVRVRGSFLMRALIAAMLVGGAASKYVSAVEVDIITTPLQPASGNLNGGTNNVLNVSSFLNSWIFNTAGGGGILELKNDTGVTINTFAFTLVGSA